MLNNFIYAKEKSLFEEALNNGEVLDEAIVFIEDTKEIWNHGTYFDGKDYFYDCSWLFNLSSDTVTLDLYDELISNYNQNKVFVLENNPIQVSYSDPGSLSFRMIRMEGSNEIIIIIVVKNSLLVEFYIKSIASQEDISDMETKTNAAATYLPIGDYATKSELPTKLSELENDVPYATTEDLNKLLSLSKYEFVDLGLPSGLRWATCNVGATKPEEYGLYFAWGESQGYTADDVANGVKAFSWDDYKFGTSSNLTKYNATDGLTILELEDDAAYVIDNTSRMPTRSEMQELIDNTTSVWVENYNETGINGYQFTASNGNSIFVPAAGICINGSVNNVGSFGNIWSSSRHYTDPTYAYVLNFYSSSLSIEFDTIRCYGYSVRAVQDAPTSSMFNPSAHLQEFNELKESVLTKIPIVNHTESVDAYTLPPNEYHVWGEVTSLIIDPDDVSDDTVYNEYMFEFVSGATATTLSLPDTIQWVTEPSIESSKTYQCSIVNNIGVIVGV